MPAGYLQDFLLPLMLHFAAIAVVSVGGGIAVLPDAYRFIVTQKQWLNSEDFTNMVALAQTAPGPNILMFSLISFQAASSYGVFWSVMAAIAGLLAFISPTCTIAFFVNRGLSAGAASLGIRAIKLGLVPLTVGIVLGSGWLLTQAAAQGEQSVRWWAYALSIVVALLSFWKTINPLWMVATGALLGLILPFN